MNGALPVVRHMILCEDIRYDPANPLRVSLDGLLSNIQPPQSPAYPYTAPCLCVFVQLTECRGSADVVLRVVQPSSSLVLYQSPAIRCTFGNDPLIV